MEGSAGAVLEGMMGILEKERPAFVIETHSPDEERACHVLLAPWAM